MPKAEKNYKQTKGAVLARERREKEKIDTLYNETLKEFMQVKYRHIITEFEPIYHAVMDRRPRTFIYTGSKEFRLWRRREIHKELQFKQDEPPVVEPVIEPVIEPVEQPVDQIVEQAEQLAGLLPDLDQLVNNAVVNEAQDLAQLINEVIVDEGISLDAWQELQADIQDFDYRMEVELGQYLQ